MVRCFLSNTVPHSLTPPLSLFPHSLSLPFLTLHSLSLPSLTHSLTHSLSSLTHSLPHYLTPSSLPHNLTHSPLSLPSLTLSLFTPSLSLPSSTPISPIPHSLQYLPSILHPYISITVKDILIDLILKLEHNLTNIRCVSYSI